MIKYIICTLLVIDLCIFLFLFLFRNGITNPAKPPTLAAAFMLVTIIAAFGLLIYLIAASVLTKIVLGFIFVIGFGLFVKGFNAPASSLTRYHAYALMIFGGGCMFIVMIGGTTALFY